MNEIESTRADAERIYAAHRSEWDFNDTWRAEARDAALAMLSTRAIRSALDVACGKAAYLAYFDLKLNIPRCVGIDTAKVQIDACRAIYPQYEFHQVDFQEFYAKERFDVVLAASILLHIPPHRVKKFVARLKQWSGKYILLINPDAARVPRDIKEYQWPHDIQALFSDCKLLAEVECADGITMTRLYGVRRNRRWPV